MASWLRFVEVPVAANRVTRSWEVVAVKSDQRLGYVGWYTAFRKYVFFPGNDTVYDANCLRDIANFTEEKTSEHREKK